MKKDVWPILKEYGFTDINKLAQHCLASLNGLNIRTQLRRQKIVSVIRQPLFYTGGINLHVLTDPQSGFDICVNDTNNREDDVSTVAHEIGHTFEACYGGFYLKQGGWNLHIIRPKFLDISEDFAEAFALLWIKHGNNRNELLELLFSSPTSLPLVL